MKKEVLYQSKRIQNFKGYRRLFYSEIIGSTGQPLVFYLNNDWDVGHRAPQLEVTLGTILIYGILIGIFGDIVLNLKRRL